ncbi:PqqD family peptide modification chaperone [Streptomyces sp. NPDC059850]|uniref:PqqD family peptide modification chaperone n=1 Tax=Streptomyces sp. NPDC059850 TaxID=3346970 RepID=UPI00365FD2B8
MWQLRETARSVLADDGGAILDERTGRWTHLTPTAAAAVMLLLSGTTEDQAAEQYAIRYGISVEHAAADVRTVADALAVRGLAVNEPRSPGCPRWWGRWR